MNRRNFVTTALATVTALLIPWRSARATTHQKNLPWGTYGKDGKQPLKWVRLGECCTEHLQAILRTQKQITNEYRIAIRTILLDRGIVS